MEGEELAESEALCSGSRALSCAIQLPARLESSLSLPQGMQAAHAQGPVAESASLLFLFAKETEGIRSLRIPARK